MCMRPFAWGGMLLVGVVAFVSLSTIRHVRHHPPTMTATILEDPKARSGDVVRVSERGRRTVVTTLTPTKAKSRRGEDFSRVVYGPVTVVGDFRESEDQAYESAVDAARGRLLHDLGLTDLPPSEWVRDRLGDRRMPETRPGVIGDLPAYRMKLDLELTRGAYLELAEADRAARSNDRMDGMARIMSILVVALGAVAGYVRLDEFTKGYYTGRLRLLTIAIVAAATFAIASV